MGDLVLSEADDKRLLQAATVGPPLGSSGDDPAIRSALEALIAPPPPPAPATWGGFSAAHPMPAGQTPGSAASAFNARAGATLANSSTLVGVLLNGISGPSAIGTLGRWAKPTYEAAGTDPKVTVRWKSPGWGEAGPFNGKAIHIPAGAQPALPTWAEDSNTDAHMEIVLCQADCDALGMPFGTTAEFWKAQWEGATLRFQSGTFGHIDGGLNTGRATAAGFECCAGQIRAPELLAGYVGHALFGVCSKAKIAKGFVWPATHSDGGGGPIYMGQRFRLQYADSEIAATSWPAWKKAIVRAAAEFGVLIGDSSGNPFGLQVECSVMYTSQGVANPLAALPANLDVTSGVDWKGRLRAVATT